MKSKALRIALAVGFVCSLWGCGGSQQVRNERSRAVCVPPPRRCANEAVAPGIFAAEPALEASRVLVQDGVANTENEEAVRFNRALAQRARTLLLAHDTQLRTRLQGTPCIQRIGIGAGPSATAVMAHHHGTGVGLWFSADLRGTPRGDQWSARTVGVTGQHAADSAGEGWSDRPRNFYVGDGYVPAPAIGDAMVLTQVRSGMQIVQGRVTAIALAPAEAPARYALTVQMENVPDATVYTNELVVTTGLGEPRVYEGAPEELRGRGNLVESAEDLLARGGDVAPGNYLVLGPGATGAFAVEYLVRRGGPGVRVTWARAFGAGPFRPEDRSPRTEFAYTSSQITRFESDANANEGGVARIRRASDGTGVLRARDDGYRAERHVACIACTTRSRERCDAAHGSCGASGVG